MELTARTKRIVTTVVAITMVAFMVPAAIMIGCDMPMTGAVCQTAMDNIVHISNACTGTWVQTHGLDGVAAAGLSTLLFALALALVATVRFLFEGRSEAMLVPARAGPPPPPTDPLGVRLTL